MDDRQFEDLYRATYDKVYNYAYSYLLDSREAEDVTSEVFLTAVSELDSFNPEIASFSTWALSITHAVLGDSRQARAASSSDNPASTGVPSRHEDDSNSRRNYDIELFSRLSHQDRELVFLKYYEDASDTEIAQILQTSPAAVAEQLVHVEAVLHATANENDRDE